MGRQKGLFKISGTLGATNYYVVKGVGYVRKAGGGFNGATIRHAPSMQSVRENASEFGQCSMVKKAFRLAISPFLEGLTGRSLHSGLMSLFLQLKALDVVSERGKRQVKLGLQTPEGQQLLSRYKITPKQALPEALQTHAVFDWTTQVLSVSKFDIRSYTIPKQGTHAGISLGVLDFNFDRLSSTLQLSPTHFLEASGDTLPFTLSPLEVIAPEFCGIAVLGIRFFEVKDGLAHELADGIGVQVLDCIFDV